VKKYKIIPFIIFFFVFIYIPKISAMQIVVQKPSIGQITLEVESSDTIEAVKEKIYQLDNSFLPENQKLIFDDNEMENGRTLGDYNVSIGSTILVFNNEKYKVIFDANGGNFTTGDTLTIEKWEIGMESALETPTREGYKFLGYYTEKTGGTKLELILAESGIDSNRTFYAQWEIISSSISSPENPQTNDNVGTSIILLVISLIGLISVIVIRKKKISNN